MIHSLQLQNFQSHKNTLLTFVSGVNVIVGPSDVGKSSLVRAMRWVVHNRPSGDDFLSHGENIVCVKLGLDNAHISRVKNPDLGKNNYILNKAELVGFGQDVPQEIFDLVDMTDINIQYQLEGPFLLGESAGTVARTLNRIVKLDKIDSSLSNVRKMETDVRTEIKALKEQVDELDEELKGEPDFVTIDILMSAITKDQNRVSQSKSLIFEMESLKKTLDSCSVTLDNLVVPEIDFTQLTEKMERFVKRKQVISNLHTLLKEVRSQTRRMVDCETAVEKCQKSLQLLCPNQCPLCGQPITPTLLSDVCTVEQDGQRGNGGECSAHVNASFGIEQETIKPSL